MDSKVDAAAAARQAVEVAAREINRLADKAGGLTGFDAFDLQRYAGICLGYENHRLTWLSKLDPKAFPDALLQKMLRETGQADEPTRAAPRTRRAAAG